MSFLILISLYNCLSAIFSLQVSLFSFSSLFSPLETNKCHHNIENLFLSKSNQRKMGYFASSTPKATEKKVNRMGTDEMREIMKGHQAEHREKSQKEMDEIRARATERKTSKDKQSAENDVLRAQIKNGMEQHRAVSEKEMDEMRAMASERKASKERDADKVIRETVKKTLTRKQTISEVKMTELERPFFSKKDSEPSAVSVNKSGEESNFNSAPQISSPKAGIPKLNMGGISQLDRTKEANTPRTPRDRSARSDRDLLNSARTDATWFPDTGSHIGLSLIVT